SDLHHVTTIPFFIFYSMFGFQRVGDLIWAAADSRCRGFLLGGTAGRTTLAGEGLQHQDSIFYYLTVMNDNYVMPPMPEGSKEGILKGIYRFSKAKNTAAKLKAQL